MLICCEKCDKHEINQRQKYIIPCKDKFNCKEYVKEQEEMKASKEKERNEKKELHYYIEKMKNLKIKKRR